jgi:hypothetical protein
VDSGSPQTSTVAWGAELVSRLWLLPPYIITELPDKPSLNPHAPCAIVQIGWGAQCLVGELPLLETLLLTAWTTGTCGLAALHSPAVLGALREWIVGSIVPFVKY